MTTLDFRAMRTVNQSWFVREDPCALGPDGPNHFLWFHRVAASFPSLKFVVVDGISSFNTAAASLDKAFQVRPLNSSSPNSGRYLVTPSIAKLSTADTSGSVEVPLTESDIALSLRNDNRNFSFSRDRAFMPVLLSAANCSNLESAAITSRSWSNNLLYLDVSGTCKQRFRELFTREDLPNLRILKIRNLRLTTVELTPILKKLGLRVFSLDVRDNLLTDDVIRLLLLHNFLDPYEQRSHLRSVIDQDGGIPSRTSSSSRCASPERYIEDAPAYSERRDISEEQETSVIDNGRVDLRPDNVDGVMKILKEKDTFHAILDHCFPREGNDLVKATGLTNLYLAGNKLSSDALKTLLMGTNRLQLLDFGSAVQGHHRFSSRYPNVRPECQPDTVKLLVPAISQRLQWLRIHHSIVTHTPTILTVGEYHMSEKRRVNLAEETYAQEELAAWPMQFLPDMNPRIQTLILTSVPWKSLGLVIRSLLKFLRAVAIQESLIAKAQPAEPSRRSAQMLPGLRVFRLEFARVMNTSFRQTATLQAGPSVSQQADADNFLKESMNDFSFFDDNDQSPVAATQDFSFFTGEGPSSQNRSQSISSTSDDVENTVLRDVKEELRAYRQKTLKAYENEQKRLGKGVRVPLGAPHYHWTGRLEFVS